MGADGVLFSGDRELQSGKVTNVLEMERDVGCITM